MRKLRIRVTLDCFVEIPEDTPTLNVLRAEGLSNINNFLDQQSYAEEINLALSGCIEHAEEVANSVEIAIDELHHTQLMV